MYAAGIATVVALIEVLSFFDAGSELELSVRCVPLEDGFAEEVFIYVSMNCAVRNTGSETSSIDGVSINYLWSSSVRVGDRRKVFHRWAYWGSRGIFDREGISFPKIIEPGVTVMFNAYAPLPIGWWEKGEDGVTRVADVDDIIDEFNECNLEYRFQRCFFGAVDKNIVAYLYDTIEYPGGQGGTRPISGIEVAVSDFDYVVRHEVDFIEHFDGAYMEVDRSLLGIGYSFHPYNNLRLKWWQREITVWTYESENGRSQSGNVSGIVSSAAAYWVLITSLLGLVKISQIFARRITSGES